MKLLLTLSITLLLVGCGAGRSAARIIEKAPQPMPADSIEKHAVEQGTLPPPPKKTFKAKKVEDTNHSDQYMYPDDGAAAVKDATDVKAPVHTPSANSLMTKEECIAMISQEKFDKYTTMFGSEAASLKRCTMLKAMNQ